MRIVATADTHFGFEYGRTAVAKKESIERMNLAFENVLNEAVSKKADLVLHGGDMFNRSSPKKVVIKKAYDIIHKFAENDIPLIVIPGNHDKSVLPESLVSYFNKNIHFMNKLSLLNLSEIAILSFPFEGNSPRTTFEKIDKIAKENPAQKIIVLCHQLFDGACFGPHNHVFTNKIDTLETEKLPENVLLVISGHIHRSQELQNGRVYYTGSTERTSFMEIVEPKGYLLIDIEDDFHEVQFYETDSLQMEVIEIDIKNTIMLSSVIEEENIKNNTRTLIRFINRNLSDSEIKFLWARFPTKEYSLLRFSPRNPKIILRKLYEK
jgi:DNA repair exonuclease SbcCD nuclease subunit